MMRTKREEGSRVTPLLLRFEGGKRSEQQERALGLARSFPGTWISFRSKSARSKSHPACCLFRAWSK